MFFFQKRRDAPDCQYCLVNRGNCFGVHRVAIGPALAQNKNR